MADTCVVAQEKQIKIVLTWKLNKHKIIDSFTMQDALINLLSTTILETTITQKMHLYYNNAISISFNFFVL